MSEIKLLSGEHLLYIKKVGRITNYCFENNIILTGNEIRKCNILILCNGLKEWFERPFRSSFITKQWFSNKFYAQTKNGFKDKKHTSEYKIKASQRMKGKFQGEKNPFYGKTHTEETRKKIHNLLKGKFQGEKNPFYGKTHTEETRKKLSLKAKKWSKNNIDKMREKGINSVIKQSLGRKTSIEKKVEEELIKCNIPYMYNKILNKKFQYDFIINNNILLEVQGDYWHANPLFYGINKKPLSERQIFKKQRDKEKYEFAIQQGYKVYYIWENDIKNNNFEIIKKIIGENNVNKF